MKRTVFLERRKESSTITIFTDAGIEREKRKRERRETRIELEDTSISRLACDICEGDVI